MPKPGRKRTRSQADGGPSRRDASDDDDGEEDNAAGSAPASDAEMNDNDDDDDRSDDENGHGRRRRRQRAWRVPDGYDDRNRAFLQALCAHGALTFRQAQPLLAAILNVDRRRAANDEEGDRGGGRDGDEDEDEERVRDNDRKDLTPDDITLDDFRAFVSKAQQALAPLDFDVRSAVDHVRVVGVRRGGGDAGPDEPERLWALVSTDPDPKAHLAVLFTPRKLAFVHRLLTALFETYNTPRLEALCVTEQQALKLSRPARTAGRPSDANASSRDKGLKHSVVLALLAALVRQGWLVRSALGFYTLSTRALLELEPLLVATWGGEENDGGDGNDTWPRIKRCAACRDLLTVGLRCAWPVCRLRLHDHCEAAFWRTQVAAAAAATAESDGARRRCCPLCQTEWGMGLDDDDDGGGGGGGASPSDTNAPRHFVGERAITMTAVYRRKRRQGRASEGVDELLRTLLPRTVPAAALPVRTGGRPGRRGDEDVDNVEEEASTLQGV
ncbi:DNA repair protein [Niveomyces insectorum RCEF 264]|uniref:Non-structural maintenance of chromosomes element 1 homolog n=1 Tax=Niveomyces insectorum RCEF 264 TaxID=1081102 RepID=A0A167PUU3_9HYPO|nr:DNA repair protein [Niveomyces insectorum RCEF 264]